MTQLGHTGDMIPAPTEPGLRERKKAQTREAIAEAAVALFEQQGYDATTIEEIATRANVSPRTFFRHFDTKLEVIMEHSDAEAHDLQEMLAARPAEESPLEAIAAVLRASLVDKLRSPGSRLSREMRIVLSTPSLRHQIQEHIAEHRTEITPALAERMGVDANSITAQVVAAAVTEAVWASLERWACEGTELETAIDEALSSLDRLN